MRFVVDAQLPPALARWLVEQGHEAVHVRDLDLKAAKDAAIWDYSLAASAVIVTKDEDFALRLQLEGDGPPVIWIRVGNTRTRVLLARCSDVWPAALRALELGERLIEIA